MRLRSSTAILLVALGLAGCNHTANKSSAAQPSLVSPAPTHPSPLVDYAHAPVCEVGQLSASTSLAPAGAGTDVYRITIVDHGPPCVLRGRPPELTGIYASGRQVTLPAPPIGKDNEYAMTTRKPANLGPGMNADVVLITTIGCEQAQQQFNNPIKYSALRLRIGHGSLNVTDIAGPEPQDIGIWLPCGVAMSDFYASFTT